MTEKKATETRRDEIINASLRLIEENGLDNLNIADIATEIDLVRQPSTATSVTRKK